MDRGIWWATVHAITKSQTRLSSLPSAWFGTAWSEMIFGFPWWLRRYRICLQCRKPGFDHWVGKIPWRKEQLPTPVFWPGEFHGQRNLAGYSPWDRKESHTTEQSSCTKLLEVLVGGEMAHFQGEPSRGRGKL